MKLYYAPINFHFRFETPVVPSAHPFFVLRSVLGMNLKKICCIAKSSECVSCSFSNKCFYARIFETIVERDNEILNGVNRLSHPFSFSGNFSFNKKEVLSDFMFTLTLFGKAIDALPYIFAAFMRQETFGLFRSRTRFKIANVSFENKSLLKNDGIDMSFSAKQFSFIEKNNVRENFSGDILVELKSPLRFKVKGKYTNDFEANDFFACLFRRTQTLCSLYGEKITAFKNKIFNNFSDVKIIEKKISWLDYEHWSSRQKKSMQLGGVVGTFILRGNFSRFLLALLEFAEIAGAGKNAGFGFGQINSWKKI